MVRLCYLIAFGFCLLLTGCNSGPSLEKYYVKKSDSPNFMTVDLSPSVLKLDPAKLTVEQSKALESLDKLNILVFKKNATNDAVYQAEKDSVNAIMKNSKYEELMKVGSGKQGASVRFVGNEKKIDEFVLFGFSSDNGFGIVRVMGDNMTPNDIFTVLSIIKNSNVAPEQLKALAGLSQQ